MSNNNDRGLNNNENLGVNEGNEENLENGSLNVKEVENHDDVIDFKETYSDMIKKNDRRTIPFLTKYEKARVVGKRAMQISKGAPPLVEVGNLENPIDIALKELKEGKIPYIIRRPLPNGTFEDWRVDELRIE